jgi:protoporphyrin/coproporphyrin ferrochelatase
MRNVVVLIAHGTVSTLDDLEAFVTEIRRGRPPPQELLTELRARYEKVGGSPLLRLTEDQARAVARHTGLETRVAMRLWNPRLSHVVQDLTPSDRVVLVPLAPFSVEVYRSAAALELSKLEAPPGLVTIEAFGSLPEVVQAWSDGAEPLLRALGSHKTALLQSAHSLPQAVIDAGDSYEGEFRHAAGLVRQELVRRGAPFDPKLSEVVFQSQGAMAGAWLGPTLADSLRKVRAGGAEAVCVLPMGFVSEHIETLYDLDIEAKDDAEQLGLQFARAPALNDSPGLVLALGVAIGRALETTLAVGGEPTG